jgi:protein-S-isoprenylcysteine O-methyltransferase Ste14
VLVVMYLRLAASEERQSEQRFGQSWRDYAARTPRFIPRLGGPRRTTAAGQRP